MKIGYNSSVFLGSDCSALTFIFFRFQDFNYTVQMHSSLVRRLSLERELEVIIYLLSLYLELTLSNRLKIFHLLYIFLEFVSCERITEVCSFWHIE